MKPVKILAASFAAALALAACQKENGTTTYTTDPLAQMKNVTLSLENVTFTKSSSTDYIAADDDVVLNSLQVFFSDGTNLYQAYDAAGTAPAEVRFTTDFPFETAAEFHFLPNAVNEVIVLGNFDEIDEGTVTGKTYSLTKAQLLQTVSALNVENEQNPKALKLYGIDQSLEATDDHSDDADHPHSNPVYLAAEVSLQPTVARFEVTGFEYAAPEAADATRKYTSVTVSQLAVRNWYKTASVAFDASVTGADRDDHNSEDYIVAAGNAYTYFAEVAAKGWYSDNMNHVLAADTWSVGNLAPGTAAPYNGASEDNVLYSYHVFPGSVVPQFLAKISGQTSEGTTANLFLMTNRLVSNNATLSEIEAGNIYRMAFSFTDEDFDQPEKCIDLTVTVAKWAVNIITPEF